MKWWASTRQIVVAVAEERVEPAARRILAKTPRRSRSRIAFLVRRTTLMLPVPKLLTRASPCLRPMLYSVSSWGRPMTFTPENAAPARHQAHLATAERQPWSPVTEPVGSGSSSAAHGVDKTTFWDLIRQWPWTA